MSENIVLYDDREVLEAVLMMNVWLHVETIEKTNMFERLPKGVKKFDEKASEKLNVKFLKIGSTKHNILEH